MPAGRNQVDYTDIGFKAITAKIDAVTITYDATKVNGSAAIGLAVMLSADDTIALTSDGAAVYGKLIRVSADNFATVQNDGFATLPGGLAAVLTRGKRYVGATGVAAARGYIRDVNTAVVAELGVAIGSIVNTADTTNVVVDLG